MSELFKPIPSKVGQLVNDVRSGRIGLPDLQRPFVWADNKVRDLFDSMMKGYPIGYVMLWESPSNYEEKKSTIGDGKKIYEEPKELVIDGQQRLTALIAAMYGVQVKDKNYKYREIKISYRPLTKEFAVWTSAYDKDTEWIPKLSDVFLAKENNTFSSFRRKFIQRANEGRTRKGIALITDAEEDAIENSLNALLGLTDFSLPTLEIGYDADEEDVAEIFVRVNSGGQKLNENNFIQTLISVYENETGDKMEKFAEESRIPADKTSYNNVLAIDQAHLIRMAVGLGFKRARLKYAYMLLRGKDLDTGKFSEDERQKNLDIFKDALDKAMNITTWHAFLNCIGDAGYHSSKQIASSNVVVFSYIFYLIGKHEYHLTELQLNKCIRKWFFVSAITYYYSNSTESTAERQFADLRNVQTGEEYIAYFDTLISTIFTNDYFNVTLPYELNSSAGVSPIWNGFVASQIVLNTNLLFGNSPISKFFMPGTSGTKNAMDRHHIFPKAWLSKQGYDTDRERNQLANFAYIDYANNIDISDNPPIDYVDHYRESLGAEYDIVCKGHALPDNFEAMDYQLFLERRRVLMAEIVRKAYQKLCEMP